MIVSIWSCERHSVQVVRDERITSRSAISVDVESVVVGFALDGEIAEDKEIL